MAAVIYMISVYPVRSKEKLQKLQQILLKCFFTGAHHLTRGNSHLHLQKDARILCKNRGGFFPGNRNIDMPESISIRRNNRNTMCQYIFPMGVKVLADYRRVRQRQREHTQSPKPRSPSALQPVQKKKDHQQYDFHKVERGKRKEHLNLPKLLEDLDKNR